MPTCENTVTLVSGHNIQLYIPNAIATHGDCVFGPHDRYYVSTLTDVGLLITQPAAPPTIDDILTALTEYRHQSQRQPGTQQDASAALDRPLHFQPRDSLC
jgi:hypothetical protein